MKRMLLCINLVLPVTNVIRRWWWYIFLLCISTPWHSAFPVCLLFWITEVCCRWWLFFSEYCFSFSDCPLNSSVGDKYSCTHKWIISKTKWIFLFKFSYLYLAKFKTSQTSILIYQYPRYEETRGPVHEFVHGWGLLGWPVGIGWNLAAPTCRSRSSQPHCAWAGLRPISPDQERLVPP